MDIHVTLQHGPLSVEIDAAGDDEYQAELLDLLEFIEEYEERLEGLDSGPQTENGEETDGTVTGGQASMDQFGNGESTPEDVRDSSAAATADDDLLGSLPKKVDASPAAIREVVDVDPEGEEPPFLLVDTDEFGESRKQRQFGTALLILAAWDECYEADRMKSSLLKDALEHSGVNSSRMNEMYRIDEADSFFDKSGRGRSATVALRRPGKREGIKQLRELVN